MSKKVEFQVFHKNNDCYKKNSKYIGGDLIVYSKEGYEGEFLELMRQGYEEMAQINLELSSAINFSKDLNKYNFDDINEYEKWLFGVWYF